MELQTDKECARLCWSSVDIKIANFVMNEKSNLTIPSSPGKTDSVMLAKSLQLSNFPKWGMLGIM